MRLFACICALSLAGCVSVDQPRLSGQISQVTDQGIADANANPLRVRGAIDRERATKAFYSDVPVGGVIAFLPLGDLRLPENWRYANGSIVDDPKSPLHGRRLPNLMDARFLMGSVQEVGSVGGSNLIASDGEHDHGGETGAATQDWTRTGPPTTNAGIESFRYTPGQAVKEIRVPEQGHRHSLSAHQHGLNTESAHDHGGDKKPAWAGVTYIVRIK